jgi:formiminotetrahydrofolate cyclodeaminase
MPETPKEDMLCEPVREFISATAAKRPTPGGGSVAGVVGALGVALGEMSLNFTRGKKKFAEHEDYYRHLAGRLERAREMFQQLVHDDMAAYGMYSEATRMEDGEEKDKAVELATAAAINVPREATKLALAVMEDLLEFAPRSNRWLVTDLIAAGVLAAAAVRMSDLNVRINVPNLADREAAGQIREASAADLERAGSLLADLEEATAGMLG